MEAEEENNAEDEDKDNSEDVTDEEWNYVHTYKSFIVQRDEMIFFLVKSEQCN